MAAKTVLRDDIFVEYLVWLVTRDEEFLSVFSDAIMPNALRIPELNWIVKEALEYYKTYGMAIPKEAIRLRLSRTPESTKLDPEVIGRYYDNAPVPDEALRSYLFDYATEWFQEKALFLVMDEAAVMLGEGRHVEAQNLLAEKIPLLRAIGDADYGHDAWADAKSFFMKGIDEDYQEQNGTGIPTGLVSVDSLLRGGLRPGEMGVVMAGPAGGKTQFLTFMAREALKAGKNVVYYTLEVDSHIIFQRFWAGLLDIPIGEIPSRRDEVEKLMDAILEDSEHCGYGNLVVKMYPSKSATVQVLASHINIVERFNFKPDLLIVDYADILRANRTYQVRRDELATVYEDLRALGQTLEVPVWTASQANREGFARGHLQMEHIADSWDKAKIADYIFGICQNDTMRERSEVLLEPIKVRTNAQGQAISCVTDYSRNIILDYGYSDASVRAIMTKQKRAS